MPNLVLEKGGQTFRFGLHEEKSVTRGKYITVPFNGRDYYARYGDTPTPLKVEKEGRTYSIQYEPVEFVPFSWSANGIDSGVYNKNIFLPKGQYRITYKGSDDAISIETFTVSASQEADMKIDYQNNYRFYKIWVTIPSIYNGYQDNWHDNIGFVIERIGE